MSQAQRITAELTATRNQTVMEMERMMDNAESVREVQTSEAYQEAKRCLRMCDEGIAKWSN